MKIEDIFRREHSIAMLKAVCDNPGKPMKTYIKGTRIRFLAIRDLCDFGLLRHIEDESGIHTSKVESTELGFRVMDALTDIERMVEDTPVCRMRLWELRQSIEDGCGEGGTASTTFVPIAESP